MPRAEIEITLERGKERIDSLATRSLPPGVIEVRGRLARSLGDEPAADRALRKALDPFREIDATGHAERLARELDA